MTTGIGGSEQHRDRRATRPDVYRVMGPAQLSADSAKDSAKQDSKRPLKRPPSTPSRTSHSSPPRRSKTSDTRTAKQVLWEEKVKGYDEKDGWVHFPNYFPKEKSISRSTVRGGGLALINQTGTKGEEEEGGPRGVDGGSGGCPPSPLFLPRRYLAEKS